MKHLLRLNEYVQDTLARPKMDKILSAPMSAEMMLKKIADRYNSLISRNSSESLEDNLGLDDEFIRGLRNQFSQEDMQGAMQDNRDILNLLASIRQTEAGMSEQEKKDKAMEIVEDIFKGKGFDLKKLEFKLDILNDGDLMDAKHNVIGVSPDEFKRIKTDIQRDNPKLKKELDVRAIQNALTQGFATSIKDDFVMGDTEIEGVSFGDYYSLMDKTFNLYSKIPSALMHQVMTQSPALGRVELVWNEDKNKYVIEAKGYTILILVHEMVKGILELVSMHRDPGLEAEDEEKLMALSGTQYSEREGLQYGPGMVAKFKEFFNQVEDNLIEQREIREKNPAMMLNVLSKFYKMEDDAFLRACKSIFSEDPDKPYDLFEEFYLDGLQGKRPGSGGNQGGPSNGPSGPSGIDDDMLRDLLGGAGISLNMDPTYESKNVLDYSTYLLLEGKKDILDKWIEQGEGTRAQLIRDIDMFSRYTSKPQGEMAARIMSAPGLDNLTTLDDRRNIEKYANNYTGFRNLVSYLKRYFPVPTVSSISPGEINMAIPVIQQALNVPSTGFYDKELEDAIKKFQTDFKEGFSNDYDFEEISDKLQREGVSSLTAKEKVQLAMSAQFIKRTNDLINRMTTNIESNIAKLKDITDEKEKQELKRTIEAEEAEIVKISGELKTITNTISGGLSKPSGKLDPATLSAISFKKDIKNIPGVKDLGTLMSNEAGETVYETEDIRINRVLARKFCIETRVRFEEALIAAGMTPEKYGWCISAGSGSLYFNYRKEDTSVYLIENLKRAEYEQQKMIEYAETKDSSFKRERYGSTAYRKWRNEDAGEPLNNDQVGNVSTKFWDNYHFVVLFAVQKPTGTKYWIVSASNDADWGKPNGFEFEKVANVIWPTSMERSVRDDSRIINVPQDIIDKPFYHIPDEDEMAKIQNVLVSMPYTEIEKSELRSSGTNRLNNKYISDDQLDQLEYDQKEEWLDTSWLSNVTLANIRSNRNDINHLIKANQWKVLPDALKIKYISQTLGPNLTKEMYDEIKDKPRIIKVYSDFLKRRILESNEQFNLLANISKAKTVNELERHLLSEHEIDLISKYVDYEKIKQDIEERKAKYEEIYSKPFSVKNLRKKQSLALEISALERILEQPDFASAYSTALSAALNRILKENPASISNTADGKSKYKRAKRSSNISKIYKESNNKDIRYKGEPVVGLLDEHPGLNSLNTDWETAPKLEDLAIDVVGRFYAEKDPTRKEAYDRVIKKFISTLLTRGESVPDIYSNVSDELTDKYLNQIENVANYIKDMNPKYSKIIVDIFKRMYVYYDVSTMFNSLKVFDRNKASKLADIINGVINKFKFLDDVKGVSKLVINKDNVKSSSGLSGSQRTEHTEELG